MTAKQIKKFLIDRDLTVSEIAATVGEDLTAVSRVLNYERRTDRIRKKIQKRFGIRFTDSKNGLRKAA